MSEDLRDYRRALDAALVSAQATDEELAALYASIAAQISQALAGRDNATLATIQAEVDAAFEAALPQRVEAIRKLVRRSARTGARLGASVSERLLDTPAERPFPRVRGPSKVRLSKLIRAWDRELGQRMAIEVKRGIEERRGIIGAAQEIAKIDTLHERLPKYLDDLADIARHGARNEVKIAARGYLRFVREKLGEIQVDGSRLSSPYSLRGPTQRFIRDVTRAGQRDIDGAIERYAQERALWRARVIARTETVQAFRDEYVARASEQPGVVAMRWRLSNRHASMRPDECDVYANQNAYGLGPGGYPADEIPRSHPMCLCTVTAIVDEQHSARERGEGLPRPWEDDESPDAVGWLQANPAKAAAILGPTRLRALKAGRGVLNATGKPLPVGDL